MLGGKQALTNEICPLTDLVASFCMPERAKQPTSHMGPQRAAEAAACIWICEAGRCAGYLLIAAMMSVARDGLQVFLFLLQPDAEEGLGILASDWLGV